MAKRKGGVTVKRLNPTATIEQQSMVLRFDMFRCSEAFRFECLVELLKGETSAREIWPRLLFRHRIADTGKIKVDSMPTDPAAKPLYKRESVINLFLFSFLLLLTPWLVEHWTGKSAVIQYRVSHEGRTFPAEVSAIIKPKIGSILRVSEIGGKAKFEESQRSFSLVLIWIPRWQQSARASRTIFSL
jgi:hypothetical protein